MNFSKKSFIDFYIIVPPAFLYSIKYFSVVCIVSGIVSLADITFLCLSHQRDKKVGVLGSSEMFYS